MASLKSAASSAAEGPQFVIYHSQDETGVAVQHLLRTSSFSTANKAVALPPNPSNDYAIKLDRNAGEYYVASQSCKLALWVS